jgi:hypothetical protein
MKRTTKTYRIVAGLFSIIATLTFIGSSLAQTEAGYDSMLSRPFHQPVSPYPVEMGFAQDHSSTAAEGFMRGSAAVLQAMGNFELSDSQAQILWQQARALSRDNDLKQTEALHAQKKMWEDARIEARKERDARIAEGQLKLAQRRATIYSQTYRLSARELDMTTGQISWPQALQTAKYQAERSHLEELFRQHVGYDRPQADTAQQIARSVEALSRAIRSDASSLPRDEYLASQKFLLGLKYAAQSVAQAS